MTRMVSQAEHCVFLHIEFPIGQELAASATHLMPSIEVHLMIMYGCAHSYAWQRGLHDIEHQITYPGSNFIFHDSQGFESDSTDELEVSWNLIEKRSGETELKNQLHVIWYLDLFLYWLVNQAPCRYCIPMDSPRPILPAELEFFNKGTDR